MKGKQGFTRKIRKSLFFMQPLSLETAFETGPQQFMFRSNFDILYLFTYMIQASRLMVKAFVPCGSNHNSGEIRIRQRLPEYG
jgi:hypothetical protein